jgi:cytochrome P450
MRRTATADTELSGTPVSQGDKVVMWYSAANRDPAVYDQPFDFVVSRETNSHFSFGGGGPHFCLGAFLARMEIRILLEEMLNRKMALRQISAPTRVASNFIHGILSVEMEVV